MWNLVVVVLATGFSGGLGSGPAIEFEMSSVEFSSQETCEAALETILGGSSEQVDGFGSILKERVAIGEAVDTDQLSMKAYCLKK